MAIYEVVQPLGRRIERSQARATRRHTMGTPEMRKRMLASAAEVKTSSPQEFAAIVRDDLAKWTRLIQAAGLRKADTRP